MTSKNGFGKSPEEEFRAFVKGVDKAIGAYPVGGNTRRKRKQFKQIPDEKTSVGLRSIARPKVFTEESPALNLWMAYQWLNERHFIVRAGGKTWVADIPDSGDPKAMLVLTDFASFKRWYQTWEIDIPGDEEDEKKTVKGNPAHMWLESDDQRRHSRIITDPGPNPDPEAYNLWTGFAVKPRKGSWATIEWHLRNVVCDGNEASFEWLLRWMAYCVQRPEKQAEVAVVLQGLKGTGKGLVAKMLRLIFGKHSFHVSSPDAYLGRFNGHLMDKLFLFVDEAFWGGDIRNEGKLKAVITEDELAFEQKYQPTIMMPNRLKLMMATNEEWSVPATADERRYFVLKVSDRKKGDAPYFKKLADAVSEKGELPAFLKHLLELDLSDFDHRNPPHTEGLNEQKLASLKGFKAYWYDCLYRGEVADMGTWPKGVYFQMMRKHFTKDWRGRGSGHPESEAVTAAILKELCPSAKPGRPQRLVAEITDLMDEEAIAKLEKNKRPPRLYWLPPLDKAREEFLRAMKIDGFEWPVCDDDPPDFDVGNDNDDDSVAA